MCVLYTQNLQKQTLDFFSKRKGGGVRAGPGSAFDINIVETKIYQWETLAAPPPSPRYNFLKAYHLIIMLLIYSTLLSP